MMMHHRDWHGSLHRRRWTPGAIVVSLLLLFLGLQLLAATGALPLLALAAIFIFFSHTGDRRGLLVPGGILLGLGLGITLAHLLSPLSDACGGAAVVGGLRAGFWFVYLYDRLRHPFDPRFAGLRIPGSILLAVSAFLTTIGLTSVALWLSWSLLGWWPVLLIVGGLWLFFTNLRRRPRY